MKLYRYMSINEFLKLMSGEKLTNTNKFSMNRTDSEGFCFLGEETAYQHGYDHDEGQILTYDALSCLQFLKGIVSDEILVEFNPSESAIKKLHEGTGIYSDPQGDYGDLICITEYSTTEYDKDAFNPNRIVAFPGIKDKYSFSKALDQIKDEDLEIIYPFINQAQIEMNKSKQSYRSDIEWHECSNLPDAIRQLVLYVKISRELEEQDRLIADIKHLLGIKNRNRIKKSNSRGRNECR